MEPILVLSHVLIAIFLSAVCFGAIDFICHEIAYFPTILSKSVAGIISLFICSLAIAY
jgi:hypothetical protein